MTSLMQPSLTAAVLPAAAGVVSLALAGSLWREIRSRGTGTRVGCSETLRVVAWSAAAFTVPHVLHALPGVLVRIAADRPSPSATEFWGIIILTAVLGLSLAIAAAGFRGRKPACACCRGCAYDMSRCEDLVCPECGREAARWSDLLSRRPSRATLRAAAALAGITLATAATVTVLTHARRSDVPITVAAAPLPLADALALWADARADQILAAVRIIRRDCLSASA